MNETTKFNFCTSKTTMKRREFLKATALATLASGAQASHLLAQENTSEPKSSPSPQFAVAPPVLQNVSATGVTVCWSVSGPATGWIEFGETEALGRLARGEVNGLLLFDPRV